jgi:hypothetical protein
MNIFFWSKLIIHCIGTYFDPHSYTQNLGYELRFERRFCHHLCCAGRSLSRVVSENCPSDLRNFWPRALAQTNVLTGLLNNWGATSLNQFEKGFVFLRLFQISSLLSLDLRKSIRIYSSRHSRLTQKNIEANGSS